MTQDEALKIMESWKNFFLTGKAWTGKSYLTNIFKNNLNFKWKKVVIVAPTGVSALNVWWSTIHKTFRIFWNYPDLNVDLPLQKVLWRQIDCLLIDEISMVSPDFLDIIDAILKYERRSYEPFGGIQVWLIGDPKQLPPVIASYTDWEKKIKEALENKYWKPLTFNKAKSFEWFEILILSEVKRQNDDYFIELLNCIRWWDKTVLKKFNRWEWDENTIHLFHTNKDADKMNTEKLKLIEWDSHTYEWILEWDFNIKNSITPLLLELKIWARIMITKNWNWLVNWDTWYVVWMKDQYIIVTIDRFDSTTFDIEESTWEQIEYSWSRKEVIWTFKQLPVKLAYAISIHKSQWLSLENVSVQIKPYMENSMIYTALSRAKNFNTLYIK